MLIDGVASGSNFTAAAGDKIVVRAVSTTQFRLTPQRYLAGEYVESTVSTFAGVAASTNYGDITSIQPAAGKWSITGSVEVANVGATITLAAAAIGTASGNTLTGMVSGSTLFQFAPPTAAHNTCAVIPPFVVTTDGSTVYYLKASCTYSAGTPTAGGRISAQRIL
jgi:hypothetical protein